MYPTANQGNSVDFKETTLRIVSVVAFQLSYWSYELVSIFYVSAVIKRKASRISVHDNDIEKSINGHSEAFGTT